MTRHRSIIRLSRRAAIALGAALAFVPALAVSNARAQGAPADLIQRAKTEGEVVWYTSLIVQQAVRPAVEAFERTYPGVKVKFTRQTSADIAQRILTEARAGRMQADVFDGSTTIFKLLEADLVGAYKPAGATNFPEEMRDPQGKWVALNVYYMTAAYNTTLVKKEDAPKSYEDLLDPKWRGRIAWSDDPGVNGPPGFIAAMLGVKGRDAGMDYLRKLAQQKIVNVPASQRVVLDQVIAGEYPIALMTFNHHSAISQADGAPVEWIRLDPTIATINYLGLTKDAPHPNAARLFMEFMTSPEGQTILQKANYLPASPAVPALVENLKPDAGKFKAYAISTESQKQSFDEWLRIYTELFRK